MADNYRDYLAVHVLNEGQIVNYRALSRSLKIQSNLAKQMLYEFHRQQNAKKPSSIHATYLVTGKRQTTSSVETNGDHEPQDEESTMRSSPFVSSMPEHDATEDSEIKVTSITLAREEDLDDVKRQYEDIQSIHIYSLELAPVKNLQVLSDCNLRIAEQYQAEDPLVEWKQYGIIQSPNAKRRKRGGAPPSKSIAPAAVPKLAQQTTSTKAASKGDSPGGEDSSSRPGSRGSNSGVPSAKAAGKVPALKRDTSDIFKSFAKAKAKPKKESSGASAEATSTVQSAEPSEMEDEHMGEASEDEQGEEPDLVDPKDGHDTNRKSRAERKEMLRKMMDDDDEEMEDAPSAEVEEPAAAPISPEPVMPKKEKEEMVVSVSGGRRRGRRRVMKKKTVKDEEGYLVTKEEPVWESFSEDEPEPKAAKTAAAVTSSAKTKKAGTKQGQGSIMTFFSKK